jgi:hypothetical protein
MTDDYVAELAASLRGPRRQRKRLLDEVAAHIDDAVHAELAFNPSFLEAKRAVLDRLGEPRAIADRWNADHRFRRERRRRRLALAAFAIVAAGALGVTQYAAGKPQLALLEGATRSPAANTALAPARFAPAAGWQVRVGRPHACVGFSASRCSQVTTVASTTHFRDCLECLPHRTVAAMRAHDIAIKLTVTIERPLRMKPTFAWPPRPVRRAVAGLEGLPARIGVYQGSTVVGSRELFVLIVFGQAVPTDRQLKRANAELRRSRIG